MNQTELDQRRDFQIINANGHKLPEMAREAIGRLMKELRERRQSDSDNGWAEPSVHDVRGLPTGGLCACYWKDTDEFRLMVFHKGGFYSTDEYGGADGASEQTYPDLCIPLRLSPVVSEIAAMVKPVELV